MQVSGRLFVWMVANYTFPIIVYLSKLRGATLTVRTW